MKKVAIHNLGCKVNSYEAESMEQMLRAAGYSIVPFDENVPADVYIINTCSVTNIADRKSRQMLHKAKKMNPDAIVVAAGCYVQSDSEGVQKDEAVDLVLGNNCKINIVEALENYAADHESHISVLDLSVKQPYEELEIDKVSEHTRAYIKIQDGCNQFCSYCIIPYTRGRIRSRELDDILKEVHRLADNGYQEIVLTGIHLTSYGVDNQKGSLLEVISRIHEIEGVKRIRLGSLEPRVVTEEFVSALAAMEKVCPHFHLSLQSGCDSVLKRMNRTGDRESLTALMKKIREKIPGVTLRTTLITGFPGETEEEFTELAEFVKDIEFERLGCFAYSQEEGTPAALIPDQIDDEVKNHRAEIIMESQMNIMDRLGEKQVGGDITVLTEGFDRYAECWFGRSAMDAPDIDGKVFFSAETKPYYGEMVTVHVDEAIDGDLFGTRV